MKKHKIISLIIMIVFILSSINIVFAASTPRITLDEYEKTITKKQAVIVKGSVNIAKGQQIIVKNKKGTKVAATTVNNTGSTARFSVKIPKKYIGAGDNSFKIYSAKKKVFLVTVLNASKTQTVTVKYKKPQKSSQSITASNKSLVKGEKKKSLGAKASSGLNCTYKSSNKKIVAVNKKGELTAKGVGEVTITINQKGNSKYKAAPTKTVKVESKYSKADDILAKAKTYKGSTGYVVVTQFNYYGSNSGRTTVYKTSNWSVAADSRSTGSSAQANGKNFGLRYLKGKPGVNDEKNRIENRVRKNKDRKVPDEYHEFWVTKYDSDKNDTKGGNAIHTHIYKNPGHNYYDCYEKNSKIQKLKDKNHIDYKNISAGCTRTSDTVAKTVYNSCPYNTPYYIYKYEFKYKR